MNGTVATLARSPAAVAASPPAPARLALLGTGNVGSAVLARLARWAGTPLGDRMSLVYVANSRVALHDDRGLSPCADGPFGGVQSPYPLSSIGSRDCGGAHILIDATASEAVAARHADWLAQGIHVVTACKLGQGTSLTRWQAIRAAAAHGHACYGDSATVGAGLPLIRSIRELQAGGDRIHAIAGVLSGSLAWLFNHYDGLRPFSGFVRAARDAGYTEPDPREDLSGEDVRRKILILARSAGVELDSDGVEVESLVPDALAKLGRDEVDGALPQLDAPLRERFASARKDGCRLRFIARLENIRDGKGDARVGLEALPEDHPLAGGAGTDNKVAIWSDRYCEQPLVIQGPGAGADVTAAGLLDDVLRIAGQSL